RETDRERPSMPIIKQTTETEGINKTLKTLKLVGLSTSLAGTTPSYTPVNCFQHTDNAQFACSRTFQVCSFPFGIHFPTEAAKRAMFQASP
ncbi:hypothetical protein ACQP3J_30220, partial [Escherichia coli]